METYNNKKEFDPLMWANSDNKTNEENNTKSSMVDHHVSHPIASQGNDVLAEVRNLAKIIIERNIDITQGYQNWLNLGFALSDALGEAGREVYHNLSRMNAGYNPSECDKQYTACMRGKKQGITIKTFFKMGKDAGIDLSQLGKEQQQVQDLNAVQDLICANSANVPSGTNSGNKPIIDSFESIVPSGTMAQMAQTGLGDGKTFCNHVPSEDWPEFLKPVLDSQNEIEGKDKMVLGSINIISGILPDTYYGIYDRKKVYPPLYNIVYGRFGSSKGDLEACKQLATPLKQEMRREYEAKKAEYEEELAIWEEQGKGKNKKERGTPPKEPPYRSPIVPANSTATAFAQNLSANDESGAVYDAEAATLANMLKKTEYGDYTDMLCKAFHHEGSPLNRVDEKRNFELEHPRLSVFLTTTGSQIPLLLPAGNVDNGLASRFLFYSLPAGKVEFRNVFEHCDEPLEDIYKKLGDKILALYHALLDRKGNPIQFVLSKKQQHEFLDTFQDILLEQFAMLGEGIQGFIFRIGLSCFRYAMVLTLLRRLSERYGSGESMFDDDERAMVCDDRDFHIAMTIINCLINHTARVYSVIAVKSEDPFSKVTTKVPDDVKIFYQALPKGREFTTAEATTVAHSLKISERSAKRKLGLMVNTFLVLNHPKNGVYCKSTKVSKED